MRKCPKGCSVVALKKGDEHYVFFFDAASADATLEKLGVFASDPELSFTWYDAAMLSQRVRKLVALRRQKGTEQ